MSSPPMSSSSRRIRYSRSPSNAQNPPSKRSKPSSSADAAQNADQRVYTSICVKNINPKISDADVRHLCKKKFSKYGDNSVKIYYKNDERVAFVNFESYEDARRARHAKSGLVWENLQIVLEPVYYRRTVPAEQPIAPNPSRERSPSPKRRPRPRSPSPSPIRMRAPRSPTPPMNRPRARSPRHHRTLSPVRQRRTYSPYIPIPPDLLDYVNQRTNKKRNGSASKSPSPSRRARRRRTPSKSKSRSPTPPSPPNQKSRSKKDDFSPSRMESNVQHEPTRTLFVGNLERDVKETKIREIFGRYGTIEEIDLKVPPSSSKRAYAFIQYENMDMAFEARKAMDNRLIGKADCKIGYGKIVPTNCLWVGNIPMDMKRRDLEEAFAHYGPIKAFDYSNGDPTATVHYNEMDDAIKARSRMTGVIRINHGVKARADPETSESVRRDGLRIDYIERPTNRRFVIVRPQDTSKKDPPSRSSSASSNHSQTPKDRPKSISPEATSSAKKTKKSSKRAPSRSPSPSPSKRRSSSPPVVGRSFHGPLGCYLSTKQTKSVASTDDLMNLCEKLNRDASKNSSTPNTMYPVDYILKLRAHAARMHFLAGNPALANQVLGDAKNQQAQKTELKVTQRLRLDDRKFTEILDKIEEDVTSAKNSRKSSIANQTKFALLFSLAKNVRHNGQNNSQEHSYDEDNNSNEDQSSLTELISYLISKEAAGVIPMNLPSGDNEKESIAITLNVYPPCPLTKTILQKICPSISFANGPQTPPSRPTGNDDYLLLHIEYNN